MPDEKAYVVVIQKAIVVFHILALQKPVQKVYILGVESNRGSLSHIISMRKLIKKQQNDQRSEGMDWRWLGGLNNKNHKITHMISFTLNSG